MTTPPPLTGSPKETPPQSLWSHVRQLIGILALLVAIRIFLISPCHVPSGSMLPTMEVGDILFMSKWDYGWTRYTLPLGDKIPYFQGRMGGKDPKRGDIVVFAPPHKPSELYVKRVVGVAGDRIQMKKGILYINDKAIVMQPLESENTAYDGTKTFQAKRFKVTIPTSDGWVHYETFKQAPFGQGRGDNTEMYTVPANHIFAMGDNWDGSGDSRFMDELGFVPLDHMVGRPWFSYLSIHTEHIYWNKPWTWLFIPFNIRWNRCGYHAIQPKVTSQAPNDQGHMVENSESPSQESLSTFDQANSELSGSEVEPLIPSTAVSDHAPDVPSDRLSDNPDPSQNTEPTTPLSSDTEALKPATP